MADEIADLDLRAIVAKLETRVEALHNRNRENMNTINQLGGQVDTAEARLESMMAFLCEEGVITKHQLLREQEAWELKLREQLQPIIDRLKQIQIQQMEAARHAGHDVKTQGGIILPGAGTNI